MEHMKAGVPCELLMDSCMVAYQDVEKTVEEMQARMYLCRG